MKPLYWTAASLTADIRPLDVSTFAQLVTGYVHVPVPLALERADFLARGKAERDKIKSGPYLTACSFKPGTTRRCDANADRLVMLCLDLDDGAAPFVDSPATLATALHPYNFAAYTTANSTPAAPRLRILVDIAPCDPIYQKPGLRHIAALLGLSYTFKGIKESAVVSQPMYRPNSFRDDPSSPVIASRIDGVPLDPEDIPALYHVGEDDPGPRTYAAADEGAPSDLSYLPVGGLVPEDIREALFSVDPDCGYWQWVEIAAGLRHQFSADEEVAREAYRLFDEWSSGGNKYRSEKETYAKWKSFKPYAKGKAPVTIRSLFKFAMDAGWENTKVAAKVKRTVEDWLAATDDIDALLEEGARRIADMPFKNELVEEALVIALKRRISDVGGPTLEKATVKKQVAAARRKVKAEEMEDAGMEPWLQPWVYVATSNVFRNMLAPVEYSPAAFDNMFGVHLMPADTESELAKAGCPTIQPVKYALNIRKIPKVDGVTYDPREGNTGSPFFTYQGVTYLNEYLPGSVPVEDEVNSEMAGKWFRRLLHHLLDDPEYERTLLDFCAYIVQHPGRKIRWAPLIQGCQGAGKGSVIDYVRAALGEQNVKLVNEADMNSDFNSWRYGAQLVHLDELRSSGANRHAASNKLKDAITNDRISLNQKFRDPRVIQNVSNFIATTNFKDSLHVEGSDRRYWYVESVLQTRDQVEALNETGFWQDFHKVCSKFPGACRHYLLHHRISDDFPVNGPAPITRYREAIVDESKHPVQILIENIIADGDEPMVQSDVIHLSSLENLLAGELRHASRPSHYLRVLGYRRWDADGRVSIDGVRSYVWYHPRHWFSELGTPVEIARIRWAAREKGF